MDLTATNKAFAYVFNTPAEDHKVARVLSNREPDDSVPLLSLDVCDSLTRQNIRLVALALFTSSSGMESGQIQRQRGCTRHSHGLPSAALPGTEDSITHRAAWSAYLTNTPSTAEDSKSTLAQDTPNDITQHPVFLQQTALVEQLIQVNKKLDARLTVMEDKIGSKHPRAPTKAETSEDTCETKSPVKRRRTSPALT
ncbi:unnamed protein product [Phytophthora lilii]|uniref:Unnamed protein product n=1 Tax=Phytophthora lilii TaxID=2077276 RepID=A0A9W6TT41_9STRA|nr:unnamed protein product [Phytophthora lilii]